VQSLEIRTLPDWRWNVCTVTVTVANQLAPSVMTLSFCLFSIYFRELALDLKKNG
jgi:hypothetical protein